MSATRREFLAAGSAFGLTAVFSGRDLFAAAEAAPDLRVGILSDIHVVGATTKRWSQTTIAFFEDTLRWYRERKVDAILIAGDMADEGKVAQLVAIGEAWKRVFPANRGADGRPVEKLFCYGNHDIGWKGLWKKPGENIKEDPAAAWERAFGEKWSPVTCKTVKGYPFVGAHWGHEKEVGAWLAAHKDAIRPDRPLFVFQHPHLKGTIYGGSVWGMDAGEGARALSAYPNAVSFTGHSHTTLTDARSLWRGAFTAVGTATLTYAHPSGEESGVHENRNRAALRDEHAHMPFDEMGRHGMLMEVRGAHVVLTRWDLLHREKLGEDWAFDVPVAPSPVDDGCARVRRGRIPQFAAGANAEAARQTGRKYMSWWDTKGVEEQQIVVSFDAAHSPDDASRAWDYVVEASANGRAVRTRYVYQPGTAHAVGRTAARVTCPFPVSDFPADAKDLAFRITPRDVLGRVGSPVNCQLEERKRSV